MLAACLSQALARADGDPASDVLVSQPLFLAQDAGATSTQQAQLSLLLANAGASGYPIRVALIGSRADLGSVTELWRRPQTYAQFLGQELALTYRRPLLVVMPNGYGFNPGGGGSDQALAALRGLAPPGRALAPAAQAAVLRLAAVAGHQLAPPAASASGHTTSLGPLSWLALAIGALLVIGAWAASVRIRPLRRAAERIS